MVTIAIKGQKQFKRSLTNLANLQGLEAELDASAKMIAKTAVENLGDMTSENSSGKLASSITVTSGEQEFSRRIGSELKHAAFMEFGTIHTPPRPWLSSALATEKPTILKRISELLLRNVASNSAREE